MNTRSSLVLGVAIVLGCLIVTLFSNASSVGQGPGAGATNGRYQVAVGGPNATIVVTDTTTGQTWVNMGVDNWRSMGKAKQ